jgi:putative membrane protein
VAQSADGAEQLAGGADQLAAGAGELDAGADQLAGGLAQLDERSAALPASATRLSQGSTGVADGLQQYIEEMEAAYGCAAVPASPQCLSLEPLRDIQESAAQVAGGWAAVTGAPGSASSAPTGLYALQAGIGQSADGAAALAAGTGELTGGAQGLASGARALADGLGRLEAGARDLAVGASGLSAGADQLSDGVGQLQTGASQLATGADGLADGVGRLSTGAGELSTGAGQLADGVGQLSAGAGDLATGLDQATEQIPTYTEGERRNLASVVAEPVTAPGVEDLSTGATGPLFAVLALWIGALGLLTVFPPVAARAMGSTRGSVLLALEAFRVPAFVGLGTGAVVGGILAAVQEVSILTGVGAVAVGALASVCFVAVHQGVVGWLGNLGRGMSLLVAVLLIGTGVVSTVPDVLVGLADLLPTGAARDALLAVVVPGVGGIAGALTWLVLWTLAGLGLAVGATARARRMRVAALLRP